MTDMVSLTIDGRPIEVPKGTLVIRAAEELGIVIPRFCDHPLLDPVAACRQCLVEVEGQRKPMASCSTTCTPDMVVRTQLTSDMAKHAQEAQLEFLLVNHPLDCPQCDKGGECPLQDQTLAHGPPDTRFIDKKRVFTKNVPLSPQIVLDRERCVLCARCTRFSKQISGDPFIELFERSALEQVAMYPGDPYISYFAGNVVQICPVGALTSASYRFGARPFDLRSISGIAYQDASGANVRHDVRRGVIQRVLARTNLEVNEAWLDDKNRYGYAFVSHPDRLADPLVRGDLGALERTGWPAAIRAAAARLSAVIEAHGPEAVAVVTGGRLTDEDAYAASRFARDVLGTDHVDFRLDPHPDELEVLPALAGTQGPTYGDVERAPLVVIAGLEPHEELPLLFLRLRKAWRDRQQRIVVVGPVLGRLEEIAWQWIPTAPGDEARVLELLADDADAPAATRAALEPIRDAMGTGDGPPAVVLAGERLAASPGALQAAARLEATREMAFAWIPRRPGARGAIDAGLLPGRLPGGRALDAPGPVADAWNRLPAAPGRDLRGILQGAVDGDIKAIVCIGADPARDFVEPALAVAALEAVDTLVCLDLMPTETVRRADVVLPAVAPPERVGSFTNWEGRRQSWPQAVGAVGGALQDWDALRQIARAMGTDLGWETANDVRREAAPLMARADDAPTLAAVAAPGGADRPAAAAATDERPLTAVVLPHLLGRGTMLTGAKELLESAPPATVWVHPDSVPDGVADGAVVAVRGPAGSLELPVRITTAVARGVVVVPANSTTDPAGALRDGAGPLHVALEPVAAAAAEEGSA